MYHDVTDKKFLGRMKRECADMMNRLVQRINNEGRMEVCFFPVGSGPNNMVMQNGKGPIDLDYNLQILAIHDYRLMSGMEIKEYIRDHFDWILQQKGWRNAEDSRAVLTVWKWVTLQGNRIRFSVDLGIVRKTWYGWERLIHEKNGCFAYDRWFWNQARQMDELEEKVDWLKKNDLWNEVRDRYRDRKNDYLCANDHDHPSFVVYLETVNEIWQKYYPRQISPMFFDLRR